MQREPSIKQLLAARGITVGKADGSYREMIRDGKSLGFFTAGGAVDRFLPEERTNPTTQSRTP